MGIVGCSCDPITGVQFDSREVSEGDLFVAISNRARPQFNLLKSDGRDGHTFIDDAIDRGAICILSELPATTETSCCRVNDSLDSLWNLARFRRSQLEGPVIAVTGSNGKTTFKEYLRHLIGGFASEASFNNHIGVPLSLSRTPRSTDVATYEVGTNHPGEISPLTCLISPTIAVLLNVQEAHIGNFKDTDALKKEKLSIFRGLTSPGVAVCPHEFTDDVSHAIDGDIQICSFGSDHGCDARLEMLDEWRCLITTKNAEIVVPIPGGGEHRASTLCAIACVLEVLNVPLETLCNLPAGPPLGRGKLHEVNGIHIVDDSYNANYSSMTASLHNLTARDGTRRIAVIGQLNELGSDSPRLHRQLIPYLAHLDAVFAVGDELKVVVDELRNEITAEYFDDADNRLLNRITTFLQKGDVVLVKGSNTWFWKRNFVENLRFAISQAT